MKRFFAIGLVCVFAACLHAQVAETTVCDVLKDPASFNGKIVKIKGTAVAGLDQFVIEGKGCGRQLNAIWLSYPEGTKAKAGPAALLQLQPAANYSGALDVPQRTPVTLEKSKDFKQFDSALAEKAKTGAMCLGCPRYEVSATMVGRLDGVAKAVVKRDATGKITSWSGFGNMNAYAARLVLQSVSEVSPKEIDYSKAAALKEEAKAGDVGGGVDPVETNRSAVKAFGASSQGGQILTRITDAFNKTGEKAGTNGVLVSHGSLNEASSKEGTKGVKESPDGVLFLVGYNTSRLDGDALVRASAHMGQHVADLRTPEKGFEDAGYYEWEFRALNATDLSVTAYSQKYLILAGGYELWNATWPADERTNKITEALTGYLTNAMYLVR